MIIKRNILPYVVFQDDSVRTALTKIDANETGLVFCVDQNGVLLGLLTDGDLRRWLISTAVPKLDQAVEILINRDFVSARISDKSERIASLITKVIRVVPLVDQQGRCVALAHTRHAEMEIDGRKIGSGHASFLIAEIGNNHNGSIEMAMKLVDEAIEAKADCAKFQMRDLVSLYANNGAGNDSAEDLGSQYTLDLLNRFQLGRDDLFRVFDYCHQKGIIPLCTPWDIASLEALESYGMGAYKTASADFTNHDLLKEVAGLGKPLVCSTGMCTDGDIRDSVALLRRHGAQYSLLHCNSTYPAPFKDINLRYMDKLREVGECPIGYSSHDRGINIAVAAVSLGANIVEKHFTLDRALEGNDHRVSLLPSEFAAMVEAIRQVESALGSGESRRVSQGEMMNRESLGKSLYVNCDLAPGDVIEEHMLEVRSPGRGLPPNRKSDLVGRAARRSLKSGDLLFPTDLGDDVAEARRFRFSRRFGIPVRYHDLNVLGRLSNFDLLEFHLSYKDMGEDITRFLQDPWDMDLVVHAPELFSGDHVLDLCSLDPGYRSRSIDELRRVVEITRALREYFTRSKRPLIVVNAGGFTQNERLRKVDRRERYDLILDSLGRIDASEVEIIPQTMPPFPWHFGGQRYQNLFMDPVETRRFCDESGMRVCFDLSHAKLACNQFKWSFSTYIETVGPVSAHLHVADASGVDGEGLQIGEGDIDLAAMGRSLAAHSPESSFIPEIWQGHKNGGEGFWRALDLLEGHL